MFKYPRGGKEYQFAAEEIYNEAMVLLRSGKAHSVNSSYLDHYVRKRVIGSLIKNEGSQLITKMREEGEGLNFDDAINRLPERERNIILLIYYRKKKRYEISEDIGLSISTIYRIHRRAKKKLKQYMTETIENQCYIDDE